MTLISLLTLLLTTMTLAAAAAGQGRDRSQPAPDAHDLLAALGTATIECLGTVGPDSFDTSSGVLVRTFSSCPANREALARVDALLGVQHSVQGQIDDLADHFVRTWDAFVRSFPHGRVPSCPSWTLVNVIDAPTRESVARLVRLGRPGKENRRYAVFADDCRTSGCAVDRAVVCAGGFGDAFIVDANPRKGTIEVDPAWWLLDFGWKPSRAARSKKNGATSTATVMR
jgi:hypothetical protein